MIYLLPTKKGIHILDGEQKYIIEPPYFSLRNYRNLKKRSIIMGFVGARGSGKSCGAARTIILDYMLHGRKVWSNMDIGYNLISNGKVIPVKSRPLDKISLIDLDEIYSNGVLYLDEVNFTADARRSMSRENVAVSYILQQLRKRRLDIIWSAQSENHCDERLRFQTDIFVICEDVSMRKPKCGIGELSLWKAHDFSGVIKGRTYNNSNDNIFYQGVIRIKPWWNTFNTYQMQGMNGKEPQEQSKAPQIATEIDEYMESNEITRFPKDAMWEQWGIKDHKLRVEIGIELVNRNIVKSGNLRSYVRK